MELEGIMQSKVSQIEKDKYSTFMISLICGTEKKTQTQRSDLWF